MKIKVYKFRPLDSNEDLRRIKDIFDKGFWCSQFQDLNDPVEGGFHAKIYDAKKIYKEKRKYKICSFSGDEAFYEPTLWGYYANGFRGIAIGIEEETTKLQKVNYVDKIEIIEEYIRSDSVEKLLTTKLTPWKKEREYRFLSTEPFNEQKVGKIISVYFGNPYNFADNKEEIYNSSKKLSCYKELKNELIPFVNEKQIDCFDVELRDDGVRQGVKL